MYISLNNLIVWNDDDDDDGHDLDKPDMVIID